MALLLQSVLKYTVFVLKTEHKYVRYKGYSNAFAGFSGSSYKFTRTVEPTQGKNSAKGIKWTGNRLEIHLWSKHP